MVKFEGYAGLKLDNVIDWYSRELKVPYKRIHKVFVNAILGAVTYDAMRDALIAQLELEDSAASIETVVRTSGQSDGGTKA